MSDITNPYKSTQSDLNEQKLVVPQGFFSGTMISYLKAASPWIKFMSIIGFIGTGFMILAAIGILFLLPFIRNAISYEYAFVNSSFLLRSMNAALGVVYLAMGIIYIFPAKYLYGFSSKINLFLKTKDEHAMEHALANNASFWKFNGILVIISLAFVPLMFIFSIIAAVGTYFI